MNQLQRLNHLNLEWSTDWDALFGSSRPLIVETGFGNGAYLMALARAFPDHHVIGFEVSGKSVEKAEEKIAKSGLDNVRAIYSRGETALYHLFEPQTIHQLHVNYPDPWFKSRHSGRRFIQRDTLDLVASRLVEGGLFYLATDIVEYAEMSQELLDDTPTLDNVLDTPFVHQLDERLIQTKYEEKGFREGRRGHYFKYVRNAVPALDIPVKKELEMPHMTLRTPMQPETIAEQVEKLTHHAGDGITIAVLDGYYNPRYGTVLFEVVIEEPTISQHLGLKLAPKSQESRDSGLYTLRHGAFGLPRMTAGVHEAVRFIGEWVVGLDADAEVIQQSLRQSGRQR